MKFVKCLAVPFFLAMGVRAVAPGDLLPLPDAGFEDGSSSWQIPVGRGFASVANDQAASGKASLRIEDTRRDGGSSVLSATLKVPAPGLYQLRGKVFPVSGKGLGIYVRQFDADREKVGGPGHLIGLGGNEETWQDFSASFRVPPATTGMRIWIHSYNAARVTAYLDDFEVVFMQGIDDMKNDLEVVKRRLVQRELPDDASETEVTTMIADLEQDGTWPDIDYEDKDRAGWDLMQHMRRLTDMARAWSTPRHAYHHDPALREALMRAFDYWMAADPEAPNWWHNRIGVPRFLYRTMLMLEDELTDRQLAAGIRILSRAKLGMAGQNLIWVAEVTIARGCLTDDPALVMAAFDAIEDEISVTTRQGIQPDFSFYQHGDQLYSGGYGRGFSSDCPKFAALARETAFAFDAESVEILTNYLLEGQQWMIRAGTFDYSACGREISRKGAGRIEDLILACRAMLKLDPPRVGDFRRFLLRLEAGTAVPPELQLSGNRSFWRSEFMTHHRPDWYLSVRMTSPLVVQSETCNRENLRGQLLSDGVTYIMRNGLEYRGIFPVWDWRRLPGITAELADKQPGIANGVRGTRSFVGGVSNGNCGAAVMDFARGALTARKFWFFSDRGAVCLGAGITSDSDYPVLTSINQCRLQGPVILRDARGQRLVDDRETVSSCDWVYHDGFAYLLRDAANVRVSASGQTGSWWDINRQYEDNPIAIPVFSLGIDHGADPDDASYAYLVAPAADPGVAAELAARPPARMLTNSSRLQAAVEPDAGVYAAAFYAPGQLELDEQLTVSVNEPCLLIVRETGAGFAVTAANPENEGLKLDVTLSAPLSGEYCSWDQDAGTTTIHFELPDGRYAGKSVTRRVVRR